MFTNDDNTYRDIREKSLDKWLQDMKEHDDIAVRGGIALVESYIKTLQDENKRLQEENEVKNQYLKKMAGKK